MRNEGLTLVLFPKDPSTRFLEEIISYLEDKTTSHFFSLQIDPSDESHLKALSAISEPKYKSVVYLGHGSATSLHGAVSESYKNDKFRSKINSYILKNKELLLISCYSADLLRMLKGGGYKEGIGFGDLPTDWNDILAARELDIRAYYGFTEETLIAFRQCLIEVVKSPLAKFVKREISLVYFYYLIQLCVNKKIAKFYTEKKKGHDPLCDALLRLKYDLKYIKNYSLPFN